MENYLMKIQLLKKEKFRTFALVSATFLHLIFARVKVGLTLAYAMKVSLGPVNL